MFEQAPINRISDMHWTPPSDQDRDQMKSELNGAKQLLADVTELVELQTRLMADDARRSVIATIKPILMIVFSFVLLLGAVPVVLLGLANVLVAELEWSMYVAQFVCGGIALVIAGCLGAIAFKSFRNCANPMQRSLNELEKNLDIFREMLGHKSVGPKGDG